MTGTPVLIAHDNGQFMEHYTLDGGQTTLCYVRWADLPDNVFTNSDGSTFTVPGDKPMYYDHERDDVVTCLKCDVRSRIYKEGAHAID